MEQLMKHETETLGLIPDSLKSKLDLSPRLPATWHNRSWIRKTSSGRIPDHLRDGYITYPQAIKNAVSRVFGLLKRYAQPWRNRSK